MTWSPPFSILSLTKNIVPTCMVGTVVFLVYVLRMCNFEVKNETCCSPNIGCLLCQVLCYKGSSELSAVVTMTTSICHGLFIPCPSEKFFFAKSNVNFESILPPRLGQNLKHVPTNLSDCWMFLELGHPSILLMTMSWSNRLNGGLSRDSPGRDCNDCLLVVAVTRARSNPVQILEELALS